MVGALTVVFDARGVQERSDGLSHYVRNLVIHLLRLERDTRYIVLLRPSLVGELRRAGVLGRPGVIVRELGVPFMGLLQQAALPGVIRRDARRAPGASVYHYPHFDMPLAAHPRTVVTMYDMNHLTLPEYFQSWRRLKRVYARSMTALTVRRAAHILTISEASKQALRQRFPSLPDDRVTVTHLALDRAVWGCVPGSKGTGCREEPVPLEPGTEMAGFRERRRLGSDRFILYVGTDRAQKNVDRLLLAYRRIREQGIPHKLLLVGSVGESPRVARRIGELGLDGAVARIGHLPDEQLPLVYRCAEVFAYCSLSEGFGLPLLEAMACGVPIVTSGIGAMAEVAGACAELVDPYSVESIAQGLLTVLRSAARRQELLARAQEVVARYRWEETARKTLEVYRRVAGYQ